MTPPKDPLFRYNKFISRQIEARLPLRQTPEIPEVRDAFISDAPYPVIQPKLNDQPVKGPYLCAKVTIIMNIT